LTELIQPAFPGDTVVSSEWLEGGLSNTNLRLRLSRSEDPIVLRLYVRDAGAAKIEAALNAQVRERTPTPRFIYVASDNPVTGHPYSLMEWIDGARLEIVARALPEDQVMAVGRSVGAALAGVHGIHFPRTGFLNRELVVDDPISVGSEGLLAYLRLCLVDGLGGERLGRDLTEALLLFAERWESCRDLKRRFTKGICGRGACFRRIGGR
jgi:pimeloyl-ACP methyl ester carboxylesterase